MLKSFVVILMLSVCVFGSAYAQQKAFQEVRSEHFLIYYPANVDESYARSTAELVEEYYRDITQEFNLVRDKLWLWENRAKIFIAKDKEEYCNKFDCPSWSSACVNYEDKIIYTYPDQENRSAIFIHELTHIIFREYIGKGRLPLWLDEAAAVYVEDKYSNNKYQRQLAVLKNAIATNQHIKFSDLNQMSPSGLNNASGDAVSLFYIESFSIVSFLVKRYGRGNFSQFLYFLKNGYGFEEALAKSFQSLQTIDDLEGQWKRFYLE